MTAALGYAVLAVALGAAIAFLQGPAALAAHPAVVAIPLAISLVAVIGVGRFVGLPAIGQIPPKRQLAIGIGIVLAALMVVAGTESALRLRLPSESGLVVGVALGLSLVGAWIERDASLSGAKMAVALLYLAAGIAAISTLLTSLPPAVFWVISAILPAWQARRLVAKGELQAAFRLLNAATKMFAAVLAVSLWLPVLLMHR